MRARIHGGGASRPRQRQGGTMQRSLHRPEILAAALGLSACAAPGDAFAPRAAISSDRAAAPPAHTVRVTGGGTTTFDADLDGDGDVDGSHFGFAAVIAGDGSAHEIGRASCRERV